MEHYKQKIALTNVRFFAYHGFYPEEQLLGNEFFLDIVCFMADIAGKNDNLTNTVNYESLYQLARQEMAKPRKLLETVVENLLSTIKGQFTAVTEVEIRLRKSNPPFGGDLAIAEVGLHWKRA